MILEKVNFLCHVIKTRLIKSVQTLILPEAEFLRLTHLDDAGGEGIDLLSHGHTSVCPELAKAFYTLFLRRSLTQKSNSINL